MFPEINSFDSWFFDDAADQWGVSPIAVIQDYAVTVVLYYLYKNNLIDDCVFKGGTSIKKIYFPDARFSVDLDFDSKSAINDLAGYASKLEEKLNKLANSILGSIYVYNIERIETSSWLFFNIRYRVFEYDELTRLDIDRGPVVAPFIKHEVHTDPYISASFSIDVYPPEVLLEQKVLALIDRNTARDLWDTYFLHVVKNVRPSRPLKNIIDQYNKESNMNLDLRKVLFIIDEIVSERDFTILSEIYIPSDIQRNFDEVKRGVREFISEFLELSLMIIY